MATAAQMNAFLGKEITEICKVGYTNRADNHCAHFVSHVLGYQFGFTCRGMVAGSTAAGASIRVQELFPRCKTVGNWKDKPKALITGLVFITNPGNVNVAAKTMSNVPRKHVGIFINDEIWHYSNKGDKVVKQTPAQFANHYPAPDNAMFYGEMP